MKLTVCLLAARKDLSVMASELGLSAGGFRLAYAVQCNGNLVCDSAVCRGGRVW
jgi:hypothetical protein